MCQTCYNKGFKDYPNYQCNVEHIEDYKRGFKAKHTETPLDEGELNHVHFCEKCYQRGLEDIKNRIWLPPLSTKRGHYESYERGYSNIEKKTNQYENNTQQPKEDKIIENKPTKYITIIAISFLVLGFCIWLITRKISMQSSTISTLQTVDSSILKHNNSNPYITTDTSAKKDTLKINADTLNSKIINNNDTVAKPIIKKIDTLRSLPKIINTKKDSLLQKNVGSTFIKKDSLRFAKADSNFIKLLKTNATSNHVLTESEIAGIDKRNLKMLRNEIFAKHGYIFKNKQLNDYFLSKTWYHPVSEDVSSKLSTIEKQNADFLKKHE